MKGTFGSPNGVAGGRRKAERERRLIERVSATGQFGCAATALSPVRLFCGKPNGDPLGVHGHAWWNMAKALRRGLGTRTNLVEAYAWLSLYTTAPGGSIVGRVHMNELALKLDTAALQRAQNLAARFKAGHWQPPVARAIPEGDPRLKLSGITFGTRSPLAVINGKTLSEGESATIPVKPGTLTIKCLKIEKDSVLITAEGEDAPRLLRLRWRGAPDADYLLPRR